MYPTTLFICFAIIIVCNTHASPLPRPSVDFDVEHVYGPRRGAPAKIRLFMPPLPHKRHKKHCVDPTGCYMGRDHHHQNAPASAKVYVSTETNDNFSMLNVAPAQLADKKGAPSTAEKITTENNGKLGGNVMEQSVGMGSMDTDTKVQNITAIEPPSTKTATNSPSKSSVNIIVNDFSASSEVTDGSAKIKSNDQIEAPGS